jgi:ABC-type phosphate transport system ATPase subunit
MRIEDVLKALRSQITIVLVTNLVQQARRQPTGPHFFSMASWWKWTPRKRFFPRRRPTRGLFSTCGGFSDDARHQH